MLLGYTVFFVPRNAIFAYFRFTGNLKFTDVS